MNLQKDEKPFCAILRIVIFICILAFAISPLIFVNNSILQFLGATLILVFGLYLNSKYLDKRPFSTYGLGISKTSFIHLSAGSVIGFLAVVSMLFIGNTTDILAVSEGVSVPHLRPLIFFAFKMLLVAILEETFFRGFLYTNIYYALKHTMITKTHAVIIAMVVSSALFGLAHLGTNQSSFISITLLSINGMVWCILFVITKNLGMSIGLHFAWNFTQMQVGFTMSGNKASNSFYSIENNGSDLLTGGEYGPEAGILGMFGFGIMLVFSLAYLKLTKTF